MHPSPPEFRNLAGTPTASQPTMAALLGGSASSKALENNPTIRALTRAGLAQPDAETGISFHPALRRLEVESRSKSASRLL